MYVRQSSQESIQITDAEIWTNSKASIGDCQGRAKRSWNGGLVRHSSSGSLAGELHPCRAKGPSATQRPAWHSIPGRAPKRGCCIGGWRREWGHVDRQASTLELAMVRWARRPRAAGTRIPLPLCRVSGHGPFILARPFDPVNFAEKYITVIS